MCTSCFFVNKKYIKGLQKSKSGLERIVYWNQVQNQYLELRWSNGTYHIVT